MSAVSIWAYPWDLHDLGLQAAMTRLDEVGVTMVSLATSYHAGRFLQPGNPRRRVCFPQDGTVYYRVDPARWEGAEIVPLQADIVAQEGDMLAELVAHRDRGGPRVSCWTVCLHNSRLGMLHPDHVLRTAQGDAQYYGLCPSSPAARAYVTGLVAEIAERYRLDRIEIESPDFMGFSHGYHHEKDGLPLLPEEEFLLGLCFCRHCLARAAAAGVDGEGARQRVASLLDAAFAREVPQAQFPDFPARGLAAFADIPTLAAFLRWRTEPVTSLLAEVRLVVPPQVQLMLIDHEGSWRGGVEPAAVAPHVDGLVYCVYTTPLDRIAGLLEASRRSLGPGKALVAGFHLFNTDGLDRAGLEARVATARPLVEGLAFYNLGLVPPKRLDWIRTALAGAGAV